MLSIMTWGLFVAGCTPVRTTSQTVRLRVVDSASGKALAWAPISLKQDDRAPHPQSGEVGSEDPWFRGVTNKDGLVEFEVRYTVEDRTTGSEPPPDSDFVTGYPFLVRVNEGRTPEEESSVLMNPGGSVKGKSFTISVIQIQAPRYVETR
jgi:hypothetical protein